MTLQAYNLNIPDGPNNPSADQPKMKVNTNSIANLILQDHFGFNDNAGGNHKWVHLKNTAAPGGIGANADGVLYAQLINGNSWPVWQNALGSTVLLASATAATSPGFTSLGGGIILQWGFVNGTHGGDNHFNNADTGTVNFPTPFPNNRFIVLTNLNFTNGSPPSSSAGGTVSINSTSSNTSFIWVVNTGSGSYTSFYWFAIGN